MTMTRKDFTAAAATLKHELVESENRGEAELVARIARKMADQFSESNGAFRFDMFYAAVGLGPDGYLPVF